MIIPQEVIEGIRQAHTIILVTHQHPDGDALGSQLALWHVLKQLGKQVSIMNADPPPKVLMFLPNVEAAGLYREGAPPADLVIAVECPDAERLGVAQALLGHAKAVLNIDHHPTNTRYGTWNVLDEKAAAAGEVVYGLIQQLGALKSGAVLMNAEVAVCLYTAILTDTGRFSYSSTSPDTHRITAELLEFGLNPYELVSKIYETTSHARLRLLALSLATLKVAPDAPVAWMHVTRRMFEDTGTSSEDTEGFVNYPRSVEGVEVAVLFREDAPGEVRVSLRSVNHVKVSEIAAQCGGGGHEKASGCTISGTLEEAERKILSLVFAALRPR